MTQLDDSPTTTATHPLEPLSGGEVAAACRLLREQRDLPDTVRVSSAALAEPAKDLVKSFRAGDSIERLAKVVVYDRSDRSLAEAIVSVTGREVVSWRDVEGHKPPILLEDLAAVDAALAADPRWVAALEVRGVTDLDTVQVDPWPAGNFGTAADTGGSRFFRAVAYRRDRPDDNGYAHPIENLVALVDPDAGEIVELIDDGVVPVPVDHGRYDLASVTGNGSGVAVQDVAALEITQPDGPGFTIDGSLLAWQSWRMRVSVHPVEGLVLHEIGWRDGERLRPLIYRASLAEMVVPYGSTATSHWWKNAFDSGEIGLGKMTNSLTLGCDCLGEIRYLDATLVNEAGEPYTVPNAVCVHEEDYGILWKHHDFASQTTEVRRSRRLVVSSICTVGNYEYGFFWYFYLDGTIQHEVKMTGIVQTQALAEGEEPALATRITPHLAAPHHQHLFCVRMDMDVDGGPNSVAEVDVVALAPGAANPHANAFDTVVTPLRTELPARRVADQAASRTWLIENRSARNGMGDPVAYKLVPGYTPTMLAQDGSAVRTRAGFATKNLWVTPYAPDELRAAGDYPAQHPGGDGLPKWTAADRPVDDTDVVVWHTFGATHVVRPEDWPVMPCEYLGFTLRPQGFFDRNPALNLRPSEAVCHDD